ncbi:MAG: N-acetylglucosamine-6-phosphate deacetylase [Candidatus Auribacterota bacterium]
MKYLIEHADIYTPTGIIHNGKILISGHTIQRILTDSEPIPLDNLESYTVINAKRSCVIPGFIDLHSHGGGGADVTDASSDSIETFINFHLNHGTTGLMLTTMSGVPIKELSYHVEQLGKAMDTHESVVGVHLEGPYLNPEYAGMLPPEKLRIPNIKELEQLVDASYDTVRMLTLSPELEGALEMIQFCNEYGIIAALGHTGADYELVMKAITLGASHVTHIFNAMEPLHHRYPGSLGAALMDDRLSVQLICDGIHLHPLIVKMVVRLKSCFNVCLVTDAMRAAGMPDGEYMLGNFEKVHYHNGIVKDEKGNLASTGMTMLDAFRNILSFGDVSLSEAIHMTSTTPARVLGLQDYIGAIKEGLDADILIIDDELQIKSVFLKGKKLL